MATEKKAMKNPCSCRVYILSGRERKKKNEHLKCMLEAKWYEEK